MQKLIERGFIYEDIRLSELTKQKDSLVRLSGMIKWELFRPTLEKAMYKEAKGAG